MCSWNLPRALTMGWTSSFRLWESSDSYSQSLAQNHLSFDLVFISSNCTPLVPNCGSCWLHHLRNMLWKVCGKQSFLVHIYNTHRDTVRKKRKEREGGYRIPFSLRCCCKGRVLPLGDLFILRQKLWAWRGDFPMKCCGLCYAGSKTLWVLLVTESFKDISACLQDTFTGVSLSG